MSNISSNVNDSVLTVSLAGRVDSSNADGTEAEIKKICAENPYDALVVDVENLEYISSAGLRVLLRLRKSNAEMKVVNASSEVYDIFEMTGFTEIIPIEKAYRKLSVEGCEVIGQGANGKVYRIDPDTIIKVYMNPDSLPDIHRERELARKAFVLGIPTAIPYDVVKVGDGYGSVFELLNAKSFAKLIKAEPEKLDTFVKLYIDLLKKIHATTVKNEDMPPMKPIAVGWVKYAKDHLPADKFDKLERLVNEIPDDMHMMHGDYHIKNVMMQNDEVLLIDMDTICHGHPIFELSAMFNAYGGYSMFDHDDLEAFLGIPYDTAVQIWKKSLAEYFGTDDEAVLTVMENKAKILSYTRILRRETRHPGEDAQSHIEELAKLLCELLYKTDSLTF